MNNSTGIKVVKQNNVHCSHKGEVSSYSCREFLFSFFYSIMLIVYSCPESTVHDTQFSLIKHYSNVLANIRISKCFVYVSHTPAAQH